MNTSSTSPRSFSCLSFQFSETSTIGPFCNTIFFPLCSGTELIEGCDNTIQPPSHPFASTDIGKPLVATCMVAESPPLPTSTSPLATACMRCTRLGNVMISASMPSGARYFGIRKAAFVVVVNADPILTLRMVWPSDVRGTIAATASVVVSNLRRLIMGRVLRGGCDQKLSNFRAKAACLTCQRKAALESSERRLSSVEPSPDIPLPQPVTKEETTERRGGGIARALTMHLIHQ